MAGRNSTSRVLFSICNTFFLTVFCLLCLFPIIHILAVSFSSAPAAAAGKVALWPVNFTLKSYHFVFAKEEFWQAVLISLERVGLGLLINMFMVILTAYPLSKEKKDFRHRTVYVWIFVFTTLFGGGLIPSYMVVNATGLIDTIWALIIPGALPVFDVLLLLNFFRGIPKALEESALIDGAGHWTIMWRIYVPTSTPALAALVVFCVVGHWNSWFDGMIYMNRTVNYPLQTYLQTIIVQAPQLLKSKASAMLLQKINDRTIRAAQIFIATIPILMIYPFLQKYFMTGIVLGSVKE